MYFSRKALGDMSYERQVERWCSIDSMVCRGCWRVTRRYFCNDRLRLGKTAWAASYGLSGCLRLPAGEKMLRVYLIEWKRWETAPAEVSLIRLMWVKDSSVAVMSLARLFLTFLSYSSTSWYLSLWALWPRLETLLTTVELPSCGFIT